jgi:ATP-dependent DNA ligase
MRVVWDDKTVRLLTRNGHDWTNRYPWIVETARKIRQKQFVIDGEAVVLDVIGVPDFDALHSRQHDKEVQFCAFDILAKGADDLSWLPLTLRKTNLAQLLARRPEGHLCCTIRAWRDRAGAACNMGLEGLVSKQADRAYKQGRCDHWIKNKNA